MPITICAIRSFGTTMARAGVPVGTIQAWMGHADLSTTQLYMHYAPAQHDAARSDAAFGPAADLGSGSTSGGATQAEPDAA